MAKRKKFTKEIRGIDALFSDESKPENKSSLAKSNSVETSSRKIGDKTGLKKMSFNLEPDFCERVKAYAYNKRIPITKLIETCLEEYFLKVSDEDIQNSLEVYRKSHR